MGGVPVTIVDRGGVPVTHSDRHVPTESVAEGGLPVTVVERNGIPMRLEPAPEPPEEP